MLSNVAQPIAISANAASLIRLSSTAKAIDVPPIPSISAIETILVRRPIQRLVSQLRIMGPNNLLLSSHWCHFCDEREKNHAAKSRNGVVGTTGSNTPAIARPRSRKPRDLYAVFLNSFSLHGKYW